MDFKFQYEHKHTDKYSIELFKKFESNIEEIMNNVCNDAHEFKLDPYNYQNCFGHGANNYIFKLDERFILRFTCPLSTCEWNNSSFILHNIELIEREMNGLHIQKKVCNFDNIANIYSYGTIKICQNNSSTEILYSIMDYLKGDILNPEKKYNFQDIKLILKILIKTLLFLNNEGFSHRDIQPINIMFAKMNDINSLQLIDFGAGHSLFDEKKYIKKGCSDIYDMWSLGILCCSLLNGKFIHRCPVRIDCNNKETIIKNNDVTSIFKIQDEFTHYATYKDDDYYKDYYNKINDIYLKTIKIYPELNYLLNELLGVKNRTNESIDLKNKYENLLTLSIFKNNDKHSKPKNVNENRWRLW